MFVIRTIADPGAQANRDIVSQAQRILRRQFPALGESEIESLPQTLRHPKHADFQARLVIAHTTRRELRGFALYKIAPDLGFLWLDFLATTPEDTGGGAGGALYQRLRELAIENDRIGIFMECLPDDPDLSPNAKIREQNCARLKFYERFGARPLIKNAYATPIKPGDHDPPYLVFDPLGANELPPAETLRAVVKAILTRKYGALCPPGYIKKVVASFQEPVALRAPRYVKREVRTRIPRRQGQQIALIVNAGHDIHHVRERGYVESPVRVAAILKELEPSGLFEQTKARRCPPKYIAAVHERGFLNYLKNACEQVPEGKSVYPYVFPLRNQARPPKELPLRAGYYCIDTFTPINRNAWPAARGAVDCAYTGAALLANGKRFAYALVRPPGHHAERSSFGGFCYLNSSAVAAHYLSLYGRVSVLDIDYHHGNGTQDIFYQRKDVLTISIHAHPRNNYPYFSGFSDERGAGDGEGANRNYILKEGSSGAQYRTILERALHRVRDFDTDFLVLAFGLDTAKHDPTGSFTLGARDFSENGRMISASGIPILVVQEGGYRTRTLGTNARHFFRGLAGN